MTPTDEYPTLDSGSVFPVIESPFFQGELIIDCKVMGLDYNVSPSLEESLKNGWKLAQVVWIRDENTNYGQAPAVHHVLKAVIVKTKREDKP